MKLWSNYVMAATIDEAVQALVAAGGAARPVAGGTDLLLELQQGRHEPVETLVDVSAIPDLQRLEVRDGELFIGAGVPVSHIVRHALVRQHAPGVAEACGLIGGPQVRNTATLGGNVAHALPAADGMISLVAIGAQAEAAGAGGVRRLPILELFRGLGKSILTENNEILTGFYLPLRKPGQASAFSRIMRPQGVALPILNMAIWLQRSGDRIEQVRIAVGPAGPTPQRACEVEAFLAGKAYSPETTNAAVDLIRATMKFRTSPRRATAEYRTHLVGVLLVEVLEKAWLRSGMLEVL
ncbi:aerobic-type carbon monoxide dehydrogenase, middle subunit CoxM/CutM homologs [Longilinea arvoryzae]|uniref:Aerobic-type carbon monoxide dehydrogenase, middle subunit CoxM/CutM homologs n=1 Tax=Longilinea arvoryzae TaxID=360412 RepID=A0A0S7B7P4_9CHLR|nr:FAD binding domain-containing protein [Longilinea arvoryzae]GAP13134.1 aerobic-type carbon monoxide dehydrogenase, middle subunit CoxM/CutM homologs [Longilinea arvoryzae]